MDLPDVILIYLVISVVISMTLAGVTSFSHIKNLQTHVNPSINSEFLARFLFHKMAENWKHLKDILAFSSFFGC